MKRLKKRGVITGATLFVDFSKLGGLIVATLGVDLEAGREEEVFDLIQKQTNLIEPSLGIGKYDLCALVYSENLINLEKTTQIVKKHAGVKKITTNMWISKPVMGYENLDLRPRKRD